LLLDVAIAASNFMMINTAQYRDLQRALADLAAATREQLEILNARTLQSQRLLTTFVNQFNRRPHVMLQAAAFDRANIAIPQPEAVQQPNQPVAHEYAQAVPQEHIPPVPFFLPVQGVLPATLSPSPRTLHVLWEEWENGIGGRKPASTFTEHESGNKHLKSTYSRRKAFWSLVCHLVRRGHSSQDAINRIYGVYGHDLTISRILNRIIQDKKNDSWHVSLR
jgi:Transcriptional activator of glycolytic enzymes